VGSLPNLFIVADGMGGHNAGEVASAKSLEYSHEFIANTYGHPANIDGILDILVTSAHHANKNVYELAASTPEYLGMGTTFTACSIIGDKMAIAHIGDSRIYTINKTGITQISTDHTYVNELVKAGKIPPEDAHGHPQGNVLTRVLGCDPHTKADGSIHSLSDVQSVLLCSDGLTDMLPDDAIFDIVNKQASPEDITNALIDAANAQGGRDNISVIIINVKGEVN